MAPRKKRAKAKPKSPRRTKTTAAKTSDESEESSLADTAEKVTPTKMPAQRRTRIASSSKKFGKFRCLLETENNEEASTATTELNASTNKSSETTDNENVILMKQSMENIFENTSVEETNILLETDHDVTLELINEASLQASEMEYTESQEHQESVATEVADQLSNLNFNSEIALTEETVEKLESPNQIFNVDSIQPEFTVECVSEEVIPVLGEQEIEIDSSDIETVNVNTDVEDTDQPIKETEADEIIEQALIADMAAGVVERQQDNFEDIAQPISARASKPKSAKNTQLRKPKATSTRKKSSPNTQPSKKEPKTKGKAKKANNDKTNSDTSEGSSAASENSVRRSSRIKSISVLKLRSKGQGLVKPKTDSETKKSSKGNFNDSDTSENSNSGQTDSEKASADSPNFVTPSPGYESDHKPVKVKSRWRRSSELEMGNSAITNGNNKSNALPVSEGNQLQSAACDEKSENAAATHDEIRTRLKQFVHLKENQYLTSRVTCKEAKKMVCDCFLTTEETERGELGCGEDCLNRLLMIECGPLCPVNDRCTNKRFQKSQFSPCEVFRTDKKGLGIRATADISFGEFILEYIGEVIGPDEFEERATEYSKGKNPHYYFMSLRADAVIDATQKGNISRFINHSCEPNAETQKWTVNGELRIGFFSKRTILSGEEITFDYQFQRYGKEAQKCFCEAPTCRGWLGEEPDEEEVEEEEEEEEEDELEEQEEKETVPSIAIEQEEQAVQKEVIEALPVQITEETLEEGPVVETIAEVLPDQEMEDQTTIIAITDVPVVPPPVQEVKEVKKPVKKEKRKIIKRKVLIKDIFDDVDVDEEIEMLATTGLKNQAHTLKLSRLMVRANEAPQRTALLRILRRGELPCRRLFLDYHGLRLIHGWMNDAQQKCKIDRKQESLRLELLQTLATLPISNKTMLQDSKVLSTVETWSVKLEDITTGLDSESNSPKLETDSVTATESDNVIEPNTMKDNKNVENGNTVEVKTEKLKEEKETETAKKEELQEMNEASVVQTEDIEEIRKSVGMDIEQIRSKNQWFIEPSNKKIVDDIIDMFDDDMDISPIAFNEDDNIIEVKEVIKQPEEPDYEVEIIALATKLLDVWSVLKEIFRIPKKERIEQMKEHEREANRGYKAGLEHDAERKSRYRGLSRHRSELSERVRKGDRSLFPKINKHERRKMFAMQVEQEEVEKRFKQRDMWRQHDFAPMGPDPRFAAPFDPSRNFQWVWNQQTGQWQSFPVNMNPHNPMLNPRFGSPIPYPFNNGGAPPLPNMPPPSSIPLPVTSMPNPHSLPNMGISPANFSHPSANMPHPQMNMSHPPHLTTHMPGNIPHPSTNMPHPPTNMPHPQANIPLPPTNIPHPSSNMPHPPTIPHPVTNLPHPPTNMPPPPTNMPHPPTNMSHPPPNMPLLPSNMSHPPPPPANMLHAPSNILHPQANIPHPPLDMSQPPPNMQHLPQLPQPQPTVSHPNFSQVPTMPHPSLNVPMPNTHVPPPLPNMPLPSNNPHQPNILPLSSNPSSNPVNNMPPLSNAPPVPNMPAQPNIQQMAPVAYQDEKANDKEDVSQVQFAGPIPPPVKLPPKWKCAKDKYGRPYYYHVKNRVSQWEPPEFPSPLEVEEESSDTTSSSETSSLSSDSSSEDSEDDELNDTKLLLEIRKKFQQMDATKKPNSTPNVISEQLENKESSPDDASLLKIQEQLDDANIDNLELNKVSSLDERLQEEFNLIRKESHGKEPPAKRKRLGLVTEVHIISPRTEEDKLHAKENLRKYKENKQRLKRQKLSSSSSTSGNTGSSSSSSTGPSKKRVKVTVKNPSKSHKSTVKTKLKEVMDLNSEAAKKLKEAFRSSMAGVMVGILNPYRKPDCKEGRIVNTEDFKHLARKLTHFVMLKELKHCQNIEDLTCTESVKSKAKEFVRKYMSKFGESYTRPKDDLDY